MGDLDLVAGLLSLLLCLSGTSVQSERAGTGDCNLSEDHPGSETGCKRTTGNRQNITIASSIRPMGQPYLGRMHFFWGMRLTHPCKIFTGTGVMGGMDIPKIGVELPIYHEPVKRSYRKGFGICKQPPGRRGIHPQHFNRTSGTSPVKTSDPAG